MRLILVGCEYAGTTTLAEEIVKWRDKVMGPPTPLGIVTYHDHFTPPWFGHWDEIPDEDLKKYMELGPPLKEMFTRYQFAYHLSPQLYRDSDHILLGFHIEEAVYAPLYYGYGRAGEYGDRESMARSIEKEIIEQGPDTVIIHVKATADEIRKRMRESPHERGVIQGRRTSSTSSKGSSITTAIHSYATDLSSTRPLRRWKRRCVSSLRRSGR